jgi:hypothetical protein
MSSNVLRRLELTVAGREDDRGTRFQVGNDREHALQDLDRTAGCGTDLMDVVPDSVGCAPDAAASRSISALAAVASCTPKTARTLDCSAFFRTDSAATDNCALKPTMRDAESFVASAKTLASELHRVVLAALRAKLAAVFFNESTVTATESTMPATCASNSCANCSRRARRSAACCCSVWRWSS